MKNEAFFLLIIENSLIVTVTLTPVGNYTQVMWECLAILLIPLIFKIREIKWYDNFGPIVRALPLEAHHKMTNRQIATLWQKSKQSVIKRYRETLLG